MILTHTGWSLTIKLRYTHTSDPRLCGSLKAQRLQFEMAWFRAQGGMAAGLAGWHGVWWLYGWHGGMAWMHVAGGMAAWRHGTWLAAWPGGMAAWHGGLAWWHGMAL